MRQLLRTFALLRDVDLFSELQLQVLAGLHFGVLVRILPHEKVVDD